LNRKINGPSIKNNLVKIPPGLYGQPKETSVILEGIETGALLDTCSTVSTISESCYQHLACSIKLKTIEDILDIECAGGSQLPYSGYIEVNINTPGSTNNFNTYLVLVVPDSNYNRHIPLLIGTNILNTILQEERQQLVLPAAHIPTVLQALHDDMGHLGKDRTLSLLQDRLYWPGMYKDTKSWIEQCGRCLRRKTPTNQRAPLVLIVTSSPLELVCMDFLTLEKSKGGYQHILVITDHYTRYAQAIPTKNQLAKTTAEAFFNHFIVHYGIPKGIHSNHGTNF
jgi:hypothetical protein